MSLDAVALAHDLREEVERLRTTQKIPTEIRLSQDAYNTIRHELTFGPFGPRHAVLFDGLPCAIAFGLEGHFRIRFVQARS